MRMAIIRKLAVAGFVGILSISATSSFAKTVAECNADYTANKAAIKASGETKKDYVAACRAGTATSATTPTAAAPVATPAPPAATGKTIKECDAEYSTNKAAIKAGGQTKKDFVSACRTGNEVVPTVPVAATPAPVPAPTVAPAPQPAPVQAPVAPRPAPRATTEAPVSASEAQAKASCPSDTVVWVNSKSGIYHFAGTHNYGATEQGTYMCEAAAKAAGDRAAKNEKHP